MSSKRCVSCGRTFASNQPLKVSCCGQPIRIAGGSAKQGPTGRFRQHHHNLTEHCFQCSHWGPSEAGSCKAGCTLYKGTVCQSVTAILNGADCFDEADPKFYGAYGRGVGFLATAYTDCGGTEVWHQTLLPRLGKAVAGFVVVNPGLASGDFEKLRCPTGVGFEQARKLAQRCSTLVAWGLGSDLPRVLDGLGNPPRVISVAHCDSDSAWTVQFMREQAPYTDTAVYLLPSGIDAVPEPLRHRAQMIPNAPDPERVRCQTSREAARERLGLSDDSVALLVTSRISEEKRLHVLVDAMHHLPNRYTLLIAGNAASWSADYESRLRESGGDRVQHLGVVDPPGDLLAACDGILSAGEYEGYGLAMAEGILAGKPLISTRVGFLRESPDLARIVPHEATPKDWAAEIVADFGDAAGQCERVERGIEAFRRSHTVERFVSQWRELLGQIV